MQYPSRSTTTTTDMTSYSTITHHRRTSSLPVFDEGPSFVRSHQPGMIESYTFKKTLPSQVVNSQATRRPGEVDDYWSRKSVTTARSGEMIAGGTTRRPSDRQGQGQGLDNDYLQPTTSTPYSNKSMEYRFSSMKTPSPITKSRSFQVKGQSPRLENHFSSSSKVKYSTMAPPDGKVAVDWMEDGGTNWEKTFEKFDFTSTPSHKLAVTDDWKKEILYHQGRPASRQPPSTGTHYVEEVQSQGNRIRGSGSTSKNIGLQRGYVSDSEDSWNWLESQKEKLEAKRAMRNTGMEKGYIDAEVNRQRDLVEGKLLAELRASTSGLNRRPSESELRYRARSMDNVGVDAGEYDVVSYSRYGPSVQRGASTLSSSSRKNWSSGTGDPYSPVDGTFSRTRRSYQTLPRDARLQEYTSWSTSSRSHGGGRLEPRPLERTASALGVGGGQIGQMQNRKSPSVNTLTRQSQQDDADEEITLRPIGPGVQLLEASDRGRTLTRRTANSDGNRTLETPDIVFTPATPVRSTAPALLHSSGSGTFSSGTVRTGASNPQDIRSFRTDDEIVVEQAIPRGQIQGQVQGQGQGQGQPVRVVFGGGPQSAHTVAIPRSQVATPGGLRPTQGPTTHIQQQWYSTVQREDANRPSSAHSGVNTWQNKSTVNNNYELVHPEQKFLARPNENLVRHESLSKFASSSNYQPQQPRMQSDVDIQQMLANQQKQLEKQLLEQQRQLELQQKQLMEKQEEIQRQLEQHRLLQQQQEELQRQQVQQQRQPQVLQQQVQQKWQQQVTQHGQQQYPMIGNQGQLLQGQQGQQGQLVQQGQLMQQQYNVQPTVNPTIRDNYSKTVTVNQDFQTVPRLQNIQSSVTPAFPHEQTAGSYNYRSTYQGDASTIPSRFQSPGNVVQRQDSEPFSPTGASSPPVGNPNVCRFEMVNPTYDGSRGGIMSEKSSSVQVVYDPQRSTTIPNNLVYNGGSGSNTSFVRPQNLTDQLRLVSPSNQDASIAAESYWIQHQGRAVNQVPPVAIRSIHNQSGMTGTQIQDTHDRNGKNISVTSSVDSSMTPLSVEISRARWTEGQSSPSFYADRSSGGSLSSSRDGATDPCSPMSVKFVKDMSHHWYKPHISREEVINTLKNKPVGSFLVRDSNTYPGSYALAVKVSTVPDNAPMKKYQEDPSEELVRHFLIEPTPTGVRLKGYKNEAVFGSLAALIYQHTLTPMSLPCKLLLLTSDNGAKEFVRGVETASPSSDQLGHSATFNVLYIMSSGVELLTGPEALDRVSSMALDKASNLRTTIINMKVAPNGVTITDNNRTIFFRQHFPVDLIRYCGLDRRLRSWTYLNESSGQIMKTKIFGIITRRSGMSIENECHLFAELDPIQTPSSSVINSVNQIIQDRNRK